MSERKYERSNQRCKGEGSQRKAVIAPDSAQSKTFLKILYGLSEGQVKGLANGYRSVYLDDTPLQDANGNWNFQNVQVDFRHGTNDQTYIEGFPSVESETGIGVELKSDVAWVQAFSKYRSRRCACALEMGDQYAKPTADNGDVNGYTIKYAIDVQTDGGAWAEVLNTQLSDKTSRNYERSHRIHLPKADTGWQFACVVSRRTAHQNTSPTKCMCRLLPKLSTQNYATRTRHYWACKYHAETFSNVAKMAAELDGVEIVVPTNYYHL